MNLKVRLAVMNFLEFAVWGAYLTSMGNYLGKAGMGAEISWFYTIQGIVSIFMPTLMGIVADKYIQPQRLLGYCHLLAGLSMIGLFMMGEASAMPDEALFMAVYTFSVAFYMPTLALSNTSAFTILKTMGGYHQGFPAYPSIRYRGLHRYHVDSKLCHLGPWLIHVPLFENDYKFQYTHLQFLVSGVLSIVLFFYCFSLPQCQLVKKKARSWVETWGFDSFKLFKSREMALFFIFSCMLGMSLQVTNGYATPFITSFKGDTFAANNATFLVSISQVAEALCILLIPYFLKRYGIKVVMLIAMFAWVLRFGFFGLGNPALPGVILFVLSCIVYGVAFDFFNVSGGLFVDQKCEPKIRASAQGLFMLMTNGLGASIGTILAGQVINHYCHWENGNLMGDWQTCWFIFAGYALVVGVAFAVLFRPKKEIK